MSYRLYSSSGGTDINNYTGVCSVLELHYNSSGKDSRSMLPEGCSEAALNHLCGGH